MELFISYARVDTFLVEVNVVDILEELGHNVWFDHQLIAGRSWKDQLFEQIQACNVFVYTLTPESVISEYCQWEYKKAVEMGKPILPILLQAKTELPKSLQDIQYVDFTQGATPVSVARLSRGLASVTIAVPEEKVKNISEEPSDIPANAPQLEESVRDKKISWLANPRIIAALIAGIFVIIVATIGVLPSFIGNTPTPIVTETPSDTPLPPTATATPIPIGGITAIAGESGLRIRNEPNLQAGIVRDIPSGNRVTVLAFVIRDDLIFTNWVEVVEGDKTGYAWLNTFTVLSQQEIQQAAQEGTILVIEQFIAFVGESGLRMRSQPNLQASIVKDIPAGGKVTVLAFVIRDDLIFANWVEVVEGDKTGYAWLNTFTELSQINIEFAARDGAIPTIEWDE